MAHPVQLNETGQLEILDEEVQISTMLPPVDAVSVFGIGLNYKQHAEETKNPLPKRPGPAPPPSLKFVAVVCSFAPFAVVLQ